MIFPIAILAIENSSDRNYIEKLYIEYHRMMYWQAHKVTCSSQDLDDIVNDACIVLIRKISLLRTLDCNILRAYIISTVRNTALNYLRKQRNAQSENGEELIANFLSAEPDPDANLLREATINELMAGIEKLPELDQDVLRMKYIDDLSDKEIGAILGMKHETVRSRLTRARQRAYRIMKGDLSDDR